MKSKLSVFAVVLCMAATPAMAELFGFSVHDPVSTWDGSSAFSVSWGSATELTLSRLEAPTGTVHLYSPPQGDFSIDLTISNILAATADAIGTFAITDIDGTADTITGDITGTWYKVGSSSAILVSELSNVAFNDNGTADGLFDADDGSLSMSFVATEWDGVLSQTLTAPWFGQTRWEVENGSVDAVVLPVPAGVMLGVLGLGVVGWRLRRFA